MHHRTCLIQMIRLVAARALSMHLQLTHDSTNFEVPFLWNNTSIKVDSANPKTIGIDTEFKKLQEKSAKPQKIAQNLQQTDLLDVVVNTTLYTPDAVKVLLPFVDVVAACETGFPPGPYVLKILTLKV